MDDYTSHENKAPFNMAIARLMSLSKTLDDIREIYAKPEIPMEYKQQSKIHLLRKFFIDASAFLKEDVVDNYIHILNIESKVVAVIHQGTHGYKINGDKKITFDKELEKEMDILFIKIIRELSSTGIFMPPKDDPRFAWKQD